MRVHMKHGDDEVTIEADDALMDCNPWYRDSIHQQVRALAEALYSDPNPKMKEPTV